MSRLGLVLPQAIMFHLTSTYTDDKQQGLASNIIFKKVLSPHTLDVGDESESAAVGVFEGSSGLFWAASSGRVSYNKNI